MVALWLTGEYVSVPASVGFIALLGITVLNGVVLVSYFSQLYAQGLDMVEVVSQGARRRLRPVMMTASISGIWVNTTVIRHRPRLRNPAPLAMSGYRRLVTCHALTLICYHSFTSGLPLRNPPGISMSDICLTLLCPIAHQEHLIDHLLLATEFRYVASSNGQR